MWVRHGTLGESVRPESHIIRLSGRSLLRAPQRPVRGQLSARPSFQSYFLEKTDMSSHGASWRRPPRATPIPQHRWPSPRLGRLVPGVDGHLLWKLCQTTATPGAFCHGAGGGEAQIRSEEGSAGGLGGLAGARVLGRALDSCLSHLPPAMTFYFPIGSWRKLEGIGGVCTSLRSAFQASEVEPPCVAATADTAEPSSWP